MNNLKDIMRFLQKRNLITAYKRFRKIKRSTRTKISVDGNVLDVTIYKKGDKTVIADTLTLKTLATSTKYNTRSIRKVIDKKVRTRVVKVDNNRFKQGLNYKSTGLINNDRSINNNIIKIKELRRTSLSLKTDLVERSTPLYKKEGLLWIDITFYKHNLMTGQVIRKKRVQMGSGKQYLLYISSERQKAFDKAFNLAISQLDFSPTGYKIHWIHYAYYIKAKRR